ncbi:sulfotransferase domain-containing protein [Desulfohalobium retbaense]|uniref:Sulfotransferase domain-containing protein n=1 Tax=Desulfohalobium retbaense (strain ATCC 49708 / DSM 5692 / JCM 16813 / HR100) TaxID=485915 RepID=C8X1P8_DESRD|nr:sulfotransferase domain-containing protein [Desulfohalobium retbaense]ACV68470.1 hypothetical protein Dret_1182 [Desulfohalobium retbaense DSM 5692]
MKIQAKNKCFVFIVSGGRTGTSFLGNRLDKMIHDAFSVHEPDVFTGINKKTWQRIRTFGFYHMILGRALKKTGIRNLTQKYYSGDISYTHLCEAIINHREKYYKSIEKKLIVESYYQWYGILPALEQVFDRYKVIAIVRDPRDWVSSWINHESHFGSRDMVTRLKYRRLDPQMVGDTAFSRIWKDMSQFSKLCWTWSRVYDQILTFTKKDNNTLLVRYEDLFLTSDRDKSFIKLLDFITSFERTHFEYNFQPNLLRRRINSTNRNLFPNWRQWNKLHSQQLSEICGVQMQELGYGNEPEWLAKITVT